MKKVVIVMLAAKLGMAKSGAEEGFICYDDVLGILQQVMHKRSGFSVCDIFREFSTQCKPLR